MNLLARDIALLLCWGSSDLMICIAFSKVIDDEQRTDAFGSQDMSSEIVREYG